MKDFSGKIAVLTGGGTGMGRELARQLAAEGCSVAFCDVSTDSMAETKEICQKEAVQGTRLMTFEADVSEEDQVNAFASAVKKEFDTDHIHLLFNNAGIGGGGSIVDGDRDEWEKTFNVCWGGVYYCSRAFLPLLVAASEGHIVNTSSVNGFWASIGYLRPHTAYSAAKFAVKGFTEALINDLRVNAPHVKCSVVMPGHIGTKIAGNSQKILTGSDEISLSEDDLRRSRNMLKMLGVENADDVSADEVVAFMEERARSFEEDAPTTASDAAKIILDGVKAEQWRILVGDDAHLLDRMVRQAPEIAYEEAFYDRLITESGWKI